MIVKISDIILKDSNKWKYNSFIYFPVLRKYVKLMFVKGKILSKICAS